jgi:hypothetical protein
MALSANTALEIRNIGGETRDNALVQSGVKIYKNALLQWNAAGTAVEPCDDQPGLFFAGVAVDEVAVGDGTVRVEMFSNVEIRITANASVAADDIGKAIYAEDDEQVTEASTFGPQIGTLKEFVGSTDVWVSLTSAELGVSS